MKQKTILKILATSVSTLIISGCSTYRASSNVKVPESTTTQKNTNVLVTEGSMPSDKYTAISPLKVSVKKLTLFDKDPTKEMANEELKKSAKAIGADAVINVKYKSGVGFTTWGYIDANGLGVKLK